MVQQKVKFQLEHGVGRITLNDPEEHNTLSPQMMEELSKALDRCDDEGVRVVVITGSKGYFCSGIDVKELYQTLKEEGAQELSSHLRCLTDQLHQGIIAKIRQLSKPVIASVNGVAAGAGLGLSLACDLRIAAEDARFLLGYSNIGATANGGITYYLPRLVGAGCAAELFLLNQPISAQRALEVGLVNRLVPAQELERHTMELAVRLASGPTLAYGRVKSLMDHAWTAELNSQLTQEDQAFSEMALTGDLQEGITAFVEKRLPKFKGK